MKSKQIDSSKTKLVRVEKKLHKLLKVEAAKRGISIKALLESFINECI